jgi:phosphatidyl-myo-inositol dimannoside synthase
MRVLCLVTDAFGGHGGMSKFNRDLLISFCLHQDITEVVAIPRLVLNEVGTLPHKLNYVTKGVGNKINYMVTAMGIIKKNPKFNLIICGHINLIPIAYICSRVTRAPLILIIYGIDAWQPTSSFLINRLVGQINAFVAISDYTKCRFLNWSKLERIPSFILPPCVEIDHYGPGPKNNELLDRYGLKDKVTLMTLGRLDSFERAKGFDAVMEILPQIKKEIPNIVYLIVGDGKDRNRLEKKAKILRIADCVVFAGHISESEKADHYRLADVYVMPSQGEGFGIVFLEALACGVPVIASKLDGSCEAVKYGELGMLVNPADSSELKQAVFSALNGVNGIVPEGLKYFSFENFVARFHKILDSYK